MADIIPRTGTVWEHESGTMYAVTGCSNLATDRPAFRPTVHYVSEDGLAYSRPLAEWHAKFTQMHGKVCAQPLQKALDHLIEARRHLDRALGDAQHGR